MAASNTTDKLITKPSITASVTLPVETTSTGTSNEGGGDVRGGRNNSSAYPYRLGSDIPNIPNIPWPLLRPPKIGQKPTDVTVTAESNAHFPFSSASVTTDGVATQRLANPAGIERAPEDLDSVIRNQVGRQVDKVFSGAIKDLQGHLISKASEVDQLRVDLENMEHKEKDLFSGISQQTDFHARTKPSGNY